MNLIGWSISALGLLALIWFVYMKNSISKFSTFETFDGLKLCYYDNPGSKRALILLHGLLVDSEMNYGLKPYDNANRRTILLDARGHGCSEKPVLPSAYANRAMAKDVIALIDSLDLQEVDIMGYSMGAQTAMEVVLTGDKRVRSLILGGTSNEAGDESWFRERAQEFLTDDAPEDAALRHFADEMGSDTNAIAAWLTGAILPQIKEDDDLSTFSGPVLVINGEDDADPEPLARRFDNGKSLQVAGDHFSALEDPEFVNAVEQFLEEVN